eukprot:jgi/Ulvmu1/12381/UM009_0027.1
MQVELRLRVSLTLPTTAAAEALMSPPADASPPPPPSAAPKDATDPTTAASIAVCLNSITAAGNLSDLPISSLVPYLSANSEGYPNITRATVNLSSVDASDAPFSVAECPVTDGRPVSLSALMQASEADMQQALRTFPDLSLSVGELPELLLELDRGERFCSLTAAAVAELDRVSGRSASAAILLFPGLAETISSSDAFLAAETACAGVYQSLQAQVASLLSSGSSSVFGASDDNGAALVGSADGASPSAAVPAVCRMPHIIHHDCCLSQVGMDCQMVQRWWNEAGRHVHSLPSKLHAC